ncbi:hypothetical protein [Methylophaga pinxianii]|uniref:hypothetical protein n=1 Tax=Methylophaga pinxianii TaxID=2881052 RepID=UPI001CF3348F|nr:hypothetical protein [Methylophaga pinxianii]MCB2425372.1 hypothetical protein [Methylophaga pinxianii]UPH45474.1 hypothetical protein LGT42_013290 [Methylophaga pinxianii]
MQQIFETVKNAIYISEKKIHFVYLMLVACMCHKYSDQKNLVLSSNYNDREQFKTFIANGIKDKTLIEPNTKYKYLDGSSEVATNITLRNLFDIYLACIGVDFDLRNKTVSIEIDIIEQLIEDNKTPNMRATRDLTLEKYIDLVLRAGKYHSL